MSKNSYFLMIHRSHIWHIKLIYLNSNLLNDGCKLNYFINQFRLTESLHHEQVTAMKALLFFPEPHVVAPRGSDLLHSRHFVVYVLRCSIQWWWVHDSFLKFASRNVDRHLTERFSWHSSWSTMRQAAHLSLIRRYPALPWHDVRIQLVLRNM